jgi:hypothetical protein
MHTYTLKIKKQAFPSLQSLSTKIHVVLFQNTVVWFIYVMKRQETSWQGQQ